MQIQCLSRQSETLESLMWCECRVEGLLAKRGRLGHVDRESGGPWVGRLQIAEFK